MDYSHHPFIHPQQSKERKKYVPRPLGQFKPTQFVTYQESDKVVAKIEEKTTTEEASTTQNTLKSRWELQESNYSSDSAALLSSSLRKTESHGASNAVTAVASEDHHSHCNSCTCAPTHCLTCNCNVQPKSQRLRPMSGYIQGPEYQYQY